MQYTALQRHREKIIIIVIYIYIMLYYAQIS